LDLGVPAPRDISREELIGLLAQRDARIAAQNRQITALSTQVTDLVEANTQLVAKLAKLEHLLTRNSANSSMPILWFTNALARRSERALQGLTVLGMQSVPYMQCSGIRIKSAYIVRERFKRY
jgi:uncharacterized coiled-coil protein SlyX